jgi:hypothetical protein
MGRPTFCVGGRRHAPNGVPMPDSITASPSPTGWTHAALARSKQRRWNAAAAISCGSDRGPEGSMGREETWWRRKNYLRADGDGVRGGGGESPMAMRLQQHGGGLVQSTVENQKFNSSDEFICNSSHKFFFVRQIWRVVVKTKLEGMSFS